MITDFAEGGAKIDEAFRLDTSISRSHYGSRPKHHRQHGAWALVCASFNQPEHWSYPRHCLNYRRKLLDFCIYSWSCFDPSGSTSRGREIYSKHLVSLSRGWEGMIESEKARKAIQMRRLVQQFPLSSPKSPTILSFLHTLLKSPNWLLFFIFSYALGSSLISLGCIPAANAKLVNVTIDDFYPDPINGTKIVYQPPDAWNDGRNCEACTAKPELLRARNGTWHDSTVRNLLNSPVPWNPLSILKA